MFTIIIQISSLQLTAQSNRIKLPRRSTVTTTQLSELERVSSVMKQEMSKLQQSNEDDENTGDVVSSSTTSVDTDTLQEKRYCMLCVVCTCRCGVYKY